MTWLTVLIAAAIVAAVAAVTGLTPTRSRPVARTQLMGVARIVLLILIVILIYAAWRSHSAG
jgi:hypothetical protein